MACGCTGDGIYVGAFCHIVEICGCCGRVAQLLLFGGGGAGGQVGTARTRAMIISDVQVAQAKSSSIECPEQAELHHEAHNPDLLGG
jgi:hypothetical protein